MTTTPAIRLHGIRLQLGERQGKQVDFSLEDFELSTSESVAIVGPSGCGKSSLLRIISGLLSVDEGTVEVCESDLRSMSSRKLDVFRGRHLGLIEQTFHLLDDFSALENLTIAAHFGRVLSRAEAKTRARELLDRVGLRHSESVRPADLSIGERQRVAIARALINRPSVVLADEPTAALDSGNTEIVAALIGELCETERSALVLVTHDEELARTYPRQFDARSLVALR